MNDEQAEEFDGRFSEAYAHLVDEINSYLRIRFDSYAEATWGDALARMQLDESREQTQILRELTKAVQKLAGR